MEYAGFVYIITDRETGKAYIGKKTSKRKHVLPKNSKRKRRVISWVPNDWKDYWGSSKHLLEDVEKFGEDRFTREILRLCKSKGEMSYIEMKEQIDREVLLREDYYNAFIGGKISSNHVKGLINE